MPNLAVYVPCDHRGCIARSRDIWTKTFDGLIWPLSFCGHHSDALWAKLAAKGFEPLEHDPAHDDCDGEVVKL